MREFTRNIKSHHIISFLAAGGIVLAALNFNSQSLFKFNSLDSFVLFAQEEIKLEKGVQVSNGDLGANGKIEIDKDAIINSNLFVDEIAIDKDTTINGNISFNKLKIHKEAQILGTQTKPVSLPIAILPKIPEFQVGTQDFRFTGQANALATGSYRDIILEKNSRLTLTGGTYNLRKLELKGNSILIFPASTILNIQSKLEGQKRVSILPGQNLKPTDLAINYLGISTKQEKEEDDIEIESLLDDQEKKDYKAGKIGRPIVFGQESFLNFKLLAPKARIHVGEQTTFRGQILAKEIKIGEGSILSLDISSSLMPKQENIVSAPEGERFVVNQIVLQLIPDGTFEDALIITNSINGRIVGSISSINLYQIEVTTRTVDELDVLIQQLIAQQNLKIKSVSKNNILNLIQ